MKVYMVWVNDANGYRWLDSQWAVEQHAIDRVIEVKAAMDACISTVTKHSAFIRAGSVPDVALSPESPGAKTEPTQPTEVNPEKAEGLTCAD